MLIDPSNNDRVNFLCIGLLLGLFAGLMLGLALFSIPIKEHGKLGGILTTDRDGNLTYNGRKLKLVEEESK